MNKMTLKKTLKNVLILAVILTVGMSADAQTPFTIHGQLAKDKQGKIVLSYTDMGKSVEDSATVKDGEFQFKGTLMNPAAFALLDLNPPKPITAETAKNIDRVNFFLDGSVLTVTSDSGLKTARITGGKAQDEFLGMIKQYKPIQDQMNELRTQAATYRSEMNDTAMQRVQKQNQVLSLQVQQIDSVFIKTHPDSYVAFDLWRKKYRGIIDPALEPAFKHFTAKMQNTYEGKIMEKKIELAKKLDVGKMAPDFTLKDTLGNAVSLSSLKGKNVVVCFYISNIMYFQAFSFNLNKIYRTLHDKNLVILNVYYDNSNKGSDTIDAWKSAIAKGSMNNLINVADMDGIDGDRPVSAVAKAYGLNMSVLPQAFLIGTDGKILARHLRLNDTELASKIEKLIVK